MATVPHVRAAGISGQDQLEHESATAQVDAREVAIAADAAARIGFGTGVTAIDGRITLEAAKALGGCDVVFGCTDDNHALTGDLSRLASWVLDPRPRRRSSVVR